MTLNCFFDGSCEPINPGGNIGYGAIIKRDSEILWSLSDTWVPKNNPGATSNNIAEYLGVLAVLDQLGKGIWEDRTEKCVIHGDSKLVIMQLSGLWQIKGGLYERFARRALVLLDNLGEPIPTFKWIPRGQNAEADELSKGHLIRNEIKVKEWRRK